MPWCEGCSRFFNPNTLTAGGECPECGRSVGVGESRQEVQGAQGGQGAQREQGAVAVAAKSKKIPWHFWLLVGAATIYLGWRLIQGIVVLVG